MGSYADVADIEGLLKRTGRTPFDGSSTPTSTQVSDLIDDIEAEINGVLSAQGYTAIPASASGDVRMLRRYTSERVAAAVWGIIYSEKEYPAHVKTWLEGYGSFLSRLRRGEQHLPDQQPKSDIDGGFVIVRTPTRDNLFSNRNRLTDWDE